MFALTLMFGCDGAGESAVTDSATAVVPTDSATTYVPPAPPAPAWDAAEVGARLEAAFQHGLPEPISAAASFRDHMDHRDAACGGVDPSYNLNTGFEGCLTQGGWGYAGYANYSEFDGALRIEADVTITTPEGELFVAAGIADWSTDGVGFTADIAGTWGAPGDAGWLEGTPGVAVWGVSDGATTTLVGGFEAGEDAAYLDGLTWDPATCDAPTGAVSLRDPNGHWYTVTLAECGGCGPVDYEGQPLGELCLDLAAAWQAYVIAAGPP